MPYFAENRGSVHIVLLEDAPTEELFIREAQAGAFWAVKAHFTAHESSALVVMPTGSGKTALMTLLAFGIARQRLLIIAPSRVIIEQIAEEFSSLNIVKETGCLPVDLKPPTVHIIEHRIDSYEAWEALRQYDVVISTPNCAAPHYSDVYDDPPRDLFDTLFFDEAHHWPATTWDSLSAAFSNARIIGLTATPYRNDKKPVPGAIVYSYPLAKAIQEGIYRPIEFIPVEALGDDRRMANRLASEAQRIWQEENQEWLDFQQQVQNGRLGQNPREQTKLLVRVNRLSETQTYQNLYANLGVDLEIVSSEHTLARNREAIARARSDDQCNGLIAVGMLGEGLDLPALRIAVLHDPYKSFPITLQFVGRICRMSGQQGEHAKLLAIPSQIQDSTLGLYELNANWAELVPELADAAVGEEQERRRFAQDHWNVTTTEKEVSIHTLRPSFSIRVYEIRTPDFNIFSAMRFRGSTQQCQSFSSQNQDWRILITRTSNRPLWTTSDSISDVTFDLFIYYKVGDLLFEYSTSPGIATQIRTSWGEDTLQLVDQSRIEQIIGQGEVKAYYNVGMRRVAYASSTIPSYKMITGKHAENAVRESDGQYFSVGHLFGRLKTQDGEYVVGISGQNAKVWSSTRKHIKEFTEWCDGIALLLRNNIDSPIPYMTHLKSPSRVIQFPDCPYSVEFDEAFYEQIENGLRFEILNEDEETLSFQSALDFEIEISDPVDLDQPQQCNLSLHVGDFQIVLHYNLQNTPIFNCALLNPGIECYIRVPERNTMRTYSLNEYYAQFPPTLYLADGSAIVGSYHYPYLPIEYSVPASVFKTYDWVNDLNCDIRFEDRDRLGARNCRELERTQMLTVIEATQNLITDQLYQDREDIVVLRDHGTGEIADFVVLEPETDNALRVHLFHCKASHNNEPGARVSDAYEVLGQARKCVRWLRKKDLFDTIQQIITDKGVIQGTEESFGLLTARCSPQNARYSVHIVQPGFLIQRIQEWHDESIRLMMMSVYDQLRNDDVEFHIHGS